MSRKTYGSEALLNEIGIWRYKGHNPLGQLSCFEFIEDDGAEFYAFGIRSYTEEDLYIFESNKMYKTRSAALARIGAALDKEAE